MSPTRDSQTTSELLAAPARCVEADLRRWLVEPDTPDELAEAMRYCVLDGGKRLRPALVHLSAAAVGAGDKAPDELTRRAAVAIELIHGYSLVHDDLPAMDDDTLRRGRPTAHVQFGEAMAILAGDALLTRAFGVLAECDDPRAVPIARELAHGAGSTGMIGGQVADMGLCELPEGIEGLRYLHRCKTGALIRAAVRMGGLCARAAGEPLDALTGYGESLGLAFQVYDDLLDVTADAASLGKTPGKDAQSGKRTYVSELGLERAARFGRELTDLAIAALEPLGPAAEPLRRLADALAARTH